MIKEAKRPVIYGGLALKGARDTVTALSEKFSMPIITTAPSIGLAAPNNHPNFVGSFGRLGTKPAFEVMNSTDLVLFVGTNFPFARYWPEGLKVIQVNNAVEDMTMPTWPSLVWNCTAPPLTRNTLPAAKAFWPSFRRILPIIPGLTT